MMVNHHMDHASMSWGHPSYMSFLFILEWHYLRSSIVDDHREDPNKRTGRSAYDGQERTKAVAWWHEVVADEVAAGDVGPRAWNSTKTFWLKPSCPIRMKPLFNPKMITKLNSSLCTPKPHPSPLATPAPFPIHRTICDRRQRERTGVDGKWGSRT